MEYGQLIVNVRTAGGAYAVENASITVYNTLRTGIEMVARVRSDVSGQSPELELPAPDREESLSPGANGTGLPYANYIIQTVKEGYYSVTNNNVAVFSGVTSVQNIDMIPLSTSTDPNQPGGITYDETSDYDL